jgi:site-specific recombinase XerD
MESIQRPPDPTPPIHVFTDEQIIALLEAAARSQSPQRNIAFLLFLLDTGARVSEACALTTGDLNFSVGMCEVLGKGKKRRSLHFVRETATALRNYLISPLRQHGEREGGGAALHQHPPIKGLLHSRAVAPCSYSTTWQRRRH